MQLVIDKLGRMVLPKSVRDDFALGPGAVLNIEEQADCIVLRPVREREVVTGKDGLLVVSSAPSGDLVAAIEEHRRDRLRRAAGWGATT